MNSGSRHTEEEYKEAIKKLKKQLVIARKYATRAIRQSSLKDKYIARQYNRLEIVSKEHNIKMEELVKNVY